MHGRCFESVAAICAQPTLRQMKGMAVVGKAAELEGFDHLELPSKRVSSFRFRGTRNSWVAQDSPEARESERKREPRYLWALV